ncbi:type IV pilin protein [Poseidonibacter ostreae]|uniref:Prepilin-type N-terminal cleavage/methylation domain-containing protein n=1 Tax=Poseidonibacter ostreae TaxID=2654171 RepID=A0A6L4WV74_9BACT|nr:type II secretion system protein [Poseidonibacter ostreae]KAB7889563.1 prepilin-type N-terminal cleavage/methylation domain-containing protein [Poseidonibacter ostreae]
MKNTMKKGFTLVELLFVMAIISILAGIGISQMSGSTEAAYNTLMKGEVRTLVNLQSLYFAETGHYADLEDLEYAVPEGLTGAAIRLNGNYFCVSVYLENNVWSFRSDIEGTEGGIVNHTCDMGELISDGGSNGTANDGGLSLGGWTL